MPNTIDSSLMDRLVGLVSDEWSKRCVLPNLVTKDPIYDLGARKGDTVTMTDIQDFTAQTVVPGNFPSTFNDIIPASRSLTLNYQEGVLIQMSFLESGSAVDGTVAKVVRKAVNALCEKIDQSIFSEMAKYAYLNVGTAGTAPFASDLGILKTASTLMDINKVPVDEDRYVVLDPYGYNNATYLAQFLDADRAGGAATIETGLLPRALGFQWYQSNNVPRQTTVAGSAALNGAISAGQTTIVTDDAGGTPAATTFKVGDLIAITGNTQQYAVTAVVTGANSQTLTIYPAIVANAADNAVVTRTAAHTLNYAFHRDAVQFTARPNVEMLSMERSGNVSNFIEERTGIPLSIQYQQGFAREGWYLTCLWGVSVTPLKEGGIVRILG